MCIYIYKYTYINTHTHGYSYYSYVLDGYGSRESMIGQGEAGEPGDV